MSKKIVILIVTIMIVGLGAIGWWMTQPPRQNTQDSAQSNSADAEKFSKEYTKVGRDNRFVYATPEQVLSVLEKGSGLVFLGFPQCPWCQQLAPIVNEAAKAEQFSSIYYLDIRQARQDNDSTYQQLLEKLKDQLNKDEQGNPRIYVPDVTAVRDGRIVGHFLQETVVDDEKLTPESYWTSERREKAIEQLRQMMRQTKQIAAINQAVADGALLLDVRTKKEFTESHFAGATNLPVDDIRSGNLPNGDKSRTIYVYCRSGNRSAQAKGLLERAGFTNVVDLGGLDDVKKMGGVLSS